MFSYKNLFSNVALQPLDHLQADDQGQVPDDAVQLSHGLAVLSADYGVM